jgi:hypothetical protein
VIGGWQKFVSYEGEFVIQMPGKPDSNRVIVPTDFGQAYLNVFMLEAKDGLVYSVSYIDYSYEVFQKKSNEQILADARNGTFLNIHGKLLNESAISINKYPGKEFLVQSADAKSLIKSRLLLVKSRLYQLSVGGLKDKISLHGFNIKKFFDSFNIIEENK